MSIIFCINIRGTIDSALPLFYNSVTIFIIYELLDKFPEKIIGAELAALTLNLIGFPPNAQKLAEEVLEEIPRQVVEYYQHKNIEPKEEQDINNENIENKENNENIYYQNVNYDINQI